MKLRTQITLFFSTVSIISLLIAGFVGYYFVAEETESKIITQLVSDNKYLSSTLDGWFHSKSLMIEGLAYSLSNGTEDITPEYLNKVLNSPTNKGVLSDIYLGLTDGAMIDGSLWVPDADYDPRVRPWYKTAEAASGSVYTEAYLDMVTNKYVISAAHGVRADSGDLMGVIAADILLDTVVNKVTATTFGETGYSYLMDSDGVFLAHKDSSLLSTNIKDIPGLDALFSEMSSNNTGNTEYTYNGIDKILVYTTLKDTNWILATTIDKSEAYSELTTVVLVFAAINLLILAFVIVAAALISIRISKPIVRITQTANLLAEGDLTQNIQIKSGAKEIKALASSFNTMADGLKGLIVRINGSASTVLDSSDSVKETAELTEKISEEINNAANELARGAQDQAESVAEGAAKTESVTRAAELINTSTDQSYAQIKEVSNSVKDGVGVITKLSQLMDANKSTTTNVSNEVYQLEDKSNVIGEIVQVISGIAEQTNLLALNAAIEAARAGEHGRGFAIVADEIRKLAEQSSKSSDEIAVLLEDIRERTKLSVAQIEQVRSVVDEQEESLTETRALYDRIIEAVEKIVVSIDQVASEARSLNDTADVVSNSMSGIAAVTEESAAATEEVAASTSSLDEHVASFISQSSELVSEAHILLEAIGAFKVE